ncbi:MAG: LLM class F420-dependent oxidoreductase [Acidimicrobiia bacterium]|nr:LLM class F420-dependent oxidoreductase [Acidimicrobiia bacterium]
MKLGLQLGYWPAQPPQGMPELVSEAERLGYDSIWTAEAYGSDAFTPLAWWGARTTRVRLGTDLAQLSARTPTATAMTAMTLDHLCGGRFVLGLGVSGPQVVEGWYGQPFGRPLERTREYVEIMRRVWAREEPLTFDGAQFTLPVPAGEPRSTGLGKPLKSIVHPLRPDIPVYLGAEGPKNIALAAEIGDGWFPIFYAPTNDDYARRALAEGFAAAGARRTAETFEVAATVPVLCNDDVEAAADVMRPFLALYIGGMGAKDANFHLDVFARMGYEAEAVKIQELYLAGDKAEAIRLVPRKLVEEVALVGPQDKIRDELARWDESLMTTMLIGTHDLATIRLMAELCL